MASDRYSRQIILPEIGPEGQRRLSEASVLCIGAGGLGSPATLYLAAAGVGRIGLIDDDTVDFTNLQRQILFETVHAGSLKAAEAKRRLLALNPEIQVDAYTDRFTDRNALAFLSEYDLLLDGSDNFETKFLANDAAFKTGKPWVYGAVSGFESQVALFVPGQSSCYRCLFPGPPPIPVQNCAEAGVLGSVVGTAGTIQATLALQFLISGGSPTHPLCPETGTLSTFDFLGAWQTRSLKISRRADCATCGQDPEKIVLRYSPAACAPIRSIRPDQLKALLSDPRHQALVIDVRETSEWREGHIPQSMHWPLSRIEQGEFPSIPDRAAEVILCCRSGKRSARAALLLQEAGFPAPLNLMGGLLAWKGKLAR